MSKKDNPTKQDLNTTLSDSDIKDTKAKTDNPEIKPKKYVILRNANHWELKDPAFILSNSKGKKTYVAYNNLKKEIKERILKAVKLKILDFTDDPEHYTPPVETAASKDERPRFRWNELENQEVKSNRRIPRSPQFSSNTMSYPDPGSNVAKLLKHQPHQVLIKLPGFLSSLKKNEAIAFLKEALKMEVAGMNPSFQPRRQVVDAINEHLVRLGEKHAMLTGVKSQPDPESDSAKVTRFAL